MKLRSRDRSRVIAAEMRSFCSSVIGSMLSASIIRFCRRISDADILLDFFFKVISCASHCHYESLGPARGGPSARRRHEKLRKLATCVTGN
jgi:hypothetical protein